MCIAIVFSHIVFILSATY